MTLSYLFHRIRMLRFYAAADRNDVLLSLYLLSLYLVSLYLFHRIRLLRSVPTLAKTYLIPNPQSNVPPNH